MPLNLLFLQFDGLLNKNVSTGLSRFADDILVGAFYGRFVIAVGPSCQRE